MIYIDLLEEAFSEHRNQKIAEDQSAYMRGQFAYFGMKTETRRLVQNPFLIKETLPTKEEL